MELERPFPRQRHTIKLSHLGTGDHVIKLAVTNSLGVTGSDTVTVRVVQKP